MDTSSARLLAAESALLDCPGTQSAQVVGLLPSYISEIRDALRKRARIAQRSPMHLRRSVLNDLLEWTFRAPAVAAEELLWCVLDRPWPEPRTREQRAAAEEWRRKLLAAPDLRATLSNALLRRSEIEIETGVAIEYWVASALSARVERISIEDWDAVRDEIMAIEDASYEAERRDTAESLRQVLCQADSVVLVARKRIGARWAVVGFAFGDPIENHVHVPGVDRDENLGRNNTFYAFDLTVAPELTGMGVGRRLKEAQVREVMSLRRPNGTARYDYIVGRARWRSKARRVLQVALKLGGEVVTVLRGKEAYGSLTSSCFYYRMPLRRPASQERPGEGGRP
jgi:GNAT superfamily N-acetyltransferase